MIFCANPALPHFRLNPAKQLFYVYNLSEIKKTSFSVFKKFFFFKFQVKVMLQ